MAWRRSRRLLMILALLCCVNPVFTQADSLPAKQEVWTNQQWEQAKKDYQYQDKSKKKEEEVEKTEESVEEISTESDKTWSELLSELLSHGFGKAIVILLAALLLLFIILKLLNVKIGFQDKKINDDLSFQVQRIEDDLENSNVQSALDVALKQKEFNLAIRLLYLAVIKELNSREWIFWQKDKTNRQFLSEMLQHPDYDQFRNLTEAFELVWYGDVNLTEVEFTKLRRIFDNYLSKLNVNER